MRATKKMTTEEFIRKAREVHGDKYDYSKTEYIEPFTKICIICPIHGEFWQEPHTHLRGSGCPECGKINRKIKNTFTTEEFIIKAREVHGDWFDYSKVKYINNQTKVCIICPKHGEFWQRPSTHLQGTSCPKCSHEKRVSKRRNTNEYFISKAREVHGNKYDYSKVEYKNSDTKVCIICPEHGEFWQRPYDHIKGGGCPICNKKHKPSTEEFIRKAKEIHGNKYDYSRVNYINNNTKICIICHENDECGDEHGEFWQTPKAHLKGDGCPKCVGRNKTSEQFINEAIKVHGNKYDYSKVEYKGALVKVCIICPEHGEFWQTPANHLNGVNCPICGHGYTKQYKFNLLEEFESEYAFRAFLANNDINILTLILQNIEPKYEPIKRDIQRVLVHVNETDPIQSLREKYNSETDDSDDIELIETTDTHIDDTLDWDNDDIVNDMISQESDTTNNSDNELSMGDIIRNDEEEIKVINRLDDEHLITPEVREYIMAKYLNDRRRAWMANRDNK